MYTLSLQDYQMLRNDIMGVIYHEVGTVCLLALDAGCKAVSVSLAPTVLEVNFNTDSDFVREIENMCAAFVPGLSKFGP